MDWILPAHTHSVNYITWKSAYPSYSPQQQISYNVVNNTNQTILPFIPVAAVLSLSAVSSFTCTQKAYSKPGYMPWKSIWRNQVTLIPFHRFQKPDLSYTVHDCNPVTSNACKHITFKSHNLVVNVCMFPFPLLLSHKHKVLCHHVIFHVCYQDKGPNTLALLLSLGHR